MMTTGATLTLLEILTEFTASLPLLPSDKAHKKKQSKTKTMSDEERFTVVQMYEFAKKGNKGKMPRGFWTKVADHFHMTARTINSILKWWTANGGSKKQNYKAGQQSKYSDLINQFVKLPQ